MSALAETVPPVLNQSYEKPKLIPRKKVSEQQYWDEYYDNGDINYEWNDGYLEEKPVSDYATIAIYNWLVRLLAHYFETHHNGTMVNLEMGFRLNLAKKVTIRKPDLGVVCKNNSTQLSDRDCTYHGIFDLCIEALSDTTKQGMLHDTVVKKQEYAEAGVQEYYIVYDKGHDELRGIEFYRLENGKYQPIKRTKDNLVQSEVLKGFQFRLEDLYRRPEAKEMSLDPVYQEFVFPEFRIEKNRADNAEKNAQLEKNRANNAEENAQLEKTRADNAEQKLIRLQAFLAQHGLNLDD